MSWDLISTYGPTLEDSDIEALEDTVDVQRRGYDFVALTEWASGNTTVPAVEVGSVLEINGAVFEVNTSDIVIGTVPGGATDDLYIKLTVSGGTTVTADWSAVAPTWDTAKGGWFDGADKVLPFKVDYDGANWDNKREITSRFNEVAENTLIGTRGRLEDVEGKFLHVSSISGPNLFTAFEDLIPNAGDKMQACGGINDDTNLVPIIVSYLLRETSTSMVFNGINASFGDRAQITITTTDTDSYDVSLSW